MGSSLSGEEEPEQKEGQQDSAAASADCAQSSCPSAVGGDGKALAETVDVVSVVPTVDTSDSKALQPGTVETPSDTPVPAEPEEEAAPDSQVAPDRSNTRARSPRSPRSPLPLDSEHVRPQRELSPESEVADFDGQVPGQLHGSDQADFLLFFLLEKMALRGEKCQVKAQRTLEQQMSLKPGDDERTEISKKISWILRHGLPGPVQMSHGDLSPLAAAHARRHAPARLLPVAETGRSSVISPLSRAHLQRQEEPHPTPTSGSKDSGSLEGRALSPMSRAHYGDRRPSSDSCGRRFSDALSTSGEGQMSPLSKSHSRISHGERLPERHSFGEPSPLSMRHMKEGRVRGLFPESSSTVP
eukprot:symbB.v1.2.014301.t1/scaffold1034.1/size142864/14